MVTKIPLGVTKIQAGGVVNEGLLCLEIAQKFKKMLNSSSSIPLAKSESQRPFVVISCSHHNFYRMCTIMYCLKLIYKKPLKKIEYNDLDYAFF